MKKLILISSLLFIFQEPLASRNTDDDSCSVYLEILHETQAFLRPSDRSKTFGIVSAREVIQIEGVSGGWFGFDPGIAQAANTGVFRYRWIKNDSSVAVRGDISFLPKFPSPDPFLTYNMFFEGAVIYSEKDSFSKPLFMTINGDYAEITGPIDEDWIGVDFSRGFPSMDLKGWIERSDLNINY